MHHLLEKPENRDPRPAEIVRGLLGRGQPTSIGERAVNTLERRGRELVDRAARGGVEIEYLGINPLFDEVRLYRGHKTDWVLGPATRTEDLVVPRAERETLQRLVELGIDVSLVYVAHEVSKDRTKGFSPRFDAPVVLDPESADGVIGPVPPPTGALQAGDRLAGHSAKTLRAIGRVAPIVGAVALGIVAAPVVLAAGAFAGLAALDPIILGALPRTTSTPGAPAAWLVLAKWDW